MAQKPKSAPSAASASPAKVAAMGAVAAIAIILSLVMAWRTFYEPSPGQNASRPTLPITGQWRVKADAQIMAPPPGAPADILFVKDVLSFDATNASTGGTVTLTMANGSTQEGKVMTSQPGHIQLGVTLPNGKPSQMTIAQMGDGGPLMVTDHLTTVIFEPMSP